MLAGSPQLYISPTRTLRLDAQGPEDGGDTIHSEQRHRAPTTRIDPQRARDGRWLDGRLRGALSFLI